jgi:hypothetical protein
MEMLELLQAMLPFQGSGSNCDFGAQVRQLRTGKLSGQALAAQSSSLGATGSLGGANALGLGPDATSLFSAMMHRLPAGSLPGMRTAHLFLAFQGQALLVGIIVRGQTLFY